MLLYNEITSIIGMDELRTIVVCRKREHKHHRLIKITDRTLNVVLSRCLCVSFILTLRQKPKGVTRSRRRTGSLSVL